MCFTLWDEPTLNALKQINATGMVEFFHHGWTHEIPKNPYGTDEPIEKFLKPGAKVPNLNEFLATTYEYQKEQPCKGHSGGQ